MIKFLLFITVFFSPLAFAGYEVTEWTFGTFFGHVEDYLYEFYTFFSVSVPAMLQRATEYFYYWMILSRINSMLFFMDVSFSIAEMLLSDIGLASVMNGALASLDQDMRALISQLGIIRAINILIEAWIARFVFSFIT